MMHSHPVAAEGTTAKKTVLILVVMDDALALYYLQ